MPSSGKCSQGTDRQKAIISESFGTEWSSSNFICNNAFCFQINKFHLYGRGGRLESYARHYFLYLIIKIEKWNGAHFKFGMCWLSVRNYITFGQFKQPHETVRMAPFDNLRCNQRILIEFLVAEKKKCEYPHMCTVFGSCIFDRSTVNCWA